MTACHASTSRFIAPPSTAGWSSAALGRAESYIDGDWDCDDLVALVRLVAHSRPIQEAVDQQRGGIGSCLDRWQHHRRRNTRRGSASNIAAHYDLGNEFFRLFLDERMMYSCALYDHATASLDTASTAKLDLLCQKLRLGPDDHLLEIGGGWGGLASTPPNVTAAG